MCIFLKNELNFHFWKHQKLALFWTSLLVGGNSVHKEPASLPKNMKMLDTYFKPITVYKVSFHI